MYIPSLSLLPLVSAKAGAGEGASIFNTSLNLSIGTPISVEGVRSVNNPSTYPLGVPVSSGSPIVPPPVPEPKSSQSPAWFLNCRVPELSRIPYPSEPDTVPKFI